MKHVRNTPIVSLLLLTGLALGAGSAYAAPKKGKDASPAPSAEATAEAKQLYSTVCTSCHGAAGKGDGAAAPALNPKPRDFTTKDWQKATKDDQIDKVILEGGAAVGKSPTMPGNPQLKSKPEVVAALRALIRSFGK